MNKKVMSFILAGTMTAASLVPSTLAFADSRKVVTIGADLTEDQKNAVLKYFGVLGNNNIELLTITNQDERDHLASYVPIEQIGNYTFSCALVNPTASGGIQVKTANLSWVTSNMIASTLSTSGIVNCEVLAASPFEVSGTGALTGILMAYEQASGTTLSEEKKDLATQELVTTGQIANEVGQTQATEIVNDIKIQVIQGQVVEPEEIAEIVNTVVDRVEQEQQIVDEQTGEEETPVVSLSDEDRQKLEELAQLIAQQQYDYEDMKETLERVETNMQDINETVTQIQSDVESTEAPDVAETEETEAETLASDSILLNTDDSALGEDVNINATNAEAAPLAPEVQEVATEAASPFEITSTDESGIEQPADNGELTQEETAAADVIVEETQAPDVVVEETQAPEEQQTDAAQTEVQTEAAATLEIGEIRLVQDGSDSTKDITGANVLRYDVANADLALVGGQLTVTDVFGSVVADIDLSNTNLVGRKAVSDQVLFENGWTEGTEFLINVGEAFKTAGDYTITLNAEVAQAPADVDPLSVPATAVTDEKTVTVGSNGLQLETYDMTALTAGSQVSGTVLFDASAAVYATMTISDESVAYADALEFDLAGGVNTFTLTLQSAGKTDVTVDFFDAEGNQIGSSVQTVEVF